MSRDRLLQLAPSSLALVLCRLESTGEDRGSIAEEEYKGSHIFQDFHAANVKCFWNRRLVKAVSQVSFQGWLESWVLLVQGQSQDLEVLRDAWVRRALRPPKGFLITSLGDVSPVQMTPVSQSQFIPLAEVLCCAISDMNASQILVTQESLLEQLIKHYPGIATPSHEILYNTLGTLIKERKIYHTGEGYFIVTPQTYFITRKPPLDNKCAAVEANSTTPPSITYLVSMESCADLTKGSNQTSVSHCKSCSCFTDHSTHNILGQQTINESNDKTSRPSKESKQSVQNQATSTSRDLYTCGKIKPQPASKDKEKCSKKFGISLFWRNASRKEKTKKELLSFSAQFPPKEWPVRDEDNLDNIPRDLEHEIIKRINPVLTVDNLMKHTLLMQKAEEQKKYFSKGTSTDIIKNKPGHHVRGSGRKKNNRLSKYHRKLQSGKEKNKKDSSAPKTASQIEKEVTKTTDNAVALASEDAHDIVYKKQISNPFEGIPHTGNSSTKRHKALRERKRNNSGKPGKNRSKSLDCTRKNADVGTVCLNGERPVGDYDSEGSIHEQILPPYPDKDDLRDYPANYPQSSTLRIDDKFKQVKESGSRLGLHSEEGSHVFGNLQKNAFIQSEAVLESGRLLTHSKGTNGKKTISVSDSLQQMPTNYCKGVNNASRACSGVSNKTEPRTLRTYSSGGFKELSRYTAFTNCSNTEHADDQTLFDKVSKDEDACCSMYFEGESNHNVCHTLEEHANGDRLNWKSLHDDTSASESSQNGWNPKISYTPPVTTSVNHRENYSPSSFSSDSSQVSDRSPLHTKGCSGQPLSQYVRSSCSEIAGDHAERLRSSENVDCSIFDYCNSSDGNSVAETIQTSLNGKSEKHINAGQQSEEMRKCFEHKVKLFNSQSSPLEANQHERNENQSTTGDSGIESPRTRISLASNNSIILDNLKRRTFLQNVDVNTNSENEGLLTTSSLMQLTSAVNV
ncbi:storkhead-box protein 1 [Pelodytes ibericus]